MGVINPRNMCDHGHDHAAHGHSHAGDALCQDTTDKTNAALKGSNLGTKWADLGTYEMKVDSCCGTMEGSMKGDASDWRKAKKTGELDHTHSHEEAPHGHSHDGQACSGHH